MTNYLCSSDKLPLFFISSNNRFFSEGYKRYAFVNDSLSMTDKEMRKSFRECEHAVVIEGGHIICVGKEGRVIGRKEFREEHSDFFEVRDAFSSDLIKDGKVYVSDNLKIGEAVFLKIHNDTDGVISYERSLFIEPHGMVSIFFENFYGSGFLDLKKAGNDWGTKDWIKTILEFGKKLNAIDKSEIKIEDKKEEPKVEEKKEKEPLKKGKAPKKIEKNEIIEDKGKEEDKEPLECNDEED